MDKITRIHLAKVPYEISLNAEAMLKKYLDEIRPELDPDLADDILADIEIRITEILASRNVQRNGVVAINDVRAIEEQLGAPNQFADTDNTDQGKVQNNHGVKRLLRDADDAYIGGVASGLSAYFATDPLFIRLIFLALTFAGGFGIALYLLLWLLLPVAKTNSDKLQMRGEPVTAAALQRYRHSAQHTITSPTFKWFAQFVGKMLKISLTAMLVVGILAILSTIGFSSALLCTPPLHDLFVAYHLDYVLVGVIWLLAMAIIGLLILSLIRLWRRRSSLKIAFVTLCSILVVTLAAGATVAPFVANHYKDVYNNKNLATALTVNASANAITPTSLNLSADDNLAVSYVTTTQPIHASYVAYPGMGHPDIDLTNANGLISIRSAHLNQVAPDCIFNWCQHIYLPIKVTIYGPALNKFVVNGSALLTISDLVQKNLTLVAQHRASVSIVNSQSDQLTLDAQTGSGIDASDTSAQQANVSLEDGSYVFGPASNTMTITLPAHCSMALLELAQLPTTVSLNGQPIPASSLTQNACLIDDAKPN